MLVIKVTDKNMKTKNGFLWKLGVNYHGAGGTKPTGPGFFHSFPNIEIARLVAPIVKTNVKYDGLRAFYGEASGTVENMNGIEVASTELILHEEIPVITHLEKYAYNELSLIWRVYSDWVMSHQPSEKITDFVCKRNSHHFLFGRPYHELVIEAPTLAVWCIYDFPEKLPPNIYNYLPSGRDRPEEEPVREERSISAR